MATKAQYYVAIMPVSHSGPATNSPGMRLLSSPLTKLQPQNGATQEIALPHTNKGVAIIYSSLDGLVVNMVPL